jgi:glycosyltransferase involved in cell wall biosynthesis
MPCFNDGEHIAEAVASVAVPQADAEPGVRARRTGDAELVIVDDASSDGRTTEVLLALERDGHRVIRHERNRGPSAARNTGLAETNAPLVFPLDADDIAEPGIFAPLAAKLDEHPEAVVCFGDFVELRPNTRFLRAVPEHLDPFRVAYTNELPGTALFRRSVLEQVGGWTDPDPEVRGYEDWNLWMALAERGDAGVHAGPGIPVFRYRLHRGRVNAAARRRHRRLYTALKRAHPDMFGRLREHRAQSDLSAARKALYPIVYGGRPRLQSEPRVKRLLDRAGVWTLRR